MRLELTVISIRSLLPRIRCTIGSAPGLGNRPAGAATGFVGSGGIWGPTTAGKPPGNWTGVWALDCGEIAPAARTQNVKNGAVQRVTGKRPRLCENILVLSCLYRDVAVSCGSERWTKRR